MDLAGKASEGGPAVPSSSDSDSSDSDSSDGDSSDDSSSSDDSDEGGVDKCCMCRKDWKYRCPGCARLTCSLPCCKAHKLTYNCSGKRARSQMLNSVLQMDDNTLLQDFALMEDAGRYIGGAERRGSKRQRTVKTPFRLKKLLKATKDRGIQLKILPSTFEKHKTNSSAWDERGKCINWTVKWVFAQAQAQYVVHKVSGTRSIAQLLTDFVGLSADNVVKRNRLKHYVKAGSNELGHLQVQLKEEGRAANDPRVVVCASDAGLDAVLSGQIVHEHPELYVVTAGDPGWIDPAAAASAAAAMHDSSINDSSAAAVVLDAQAIAAAAVAAAATTADDTFMPAAVFGESKLGWVFKKGDRGTGYYKDTVPLSVTNPV